jgi:beta-galactosidase/beta-glucuronidase
VKKKPFIVPDLEYPRPQFQRRHWLPLNGEWKFSRNHTVSPSDVCWSHKIQVPYPPESPLSGRPIDSTSLPIVWYQRDFQVPSEWQGKQILLHFGAVDYAANVWVNDQLVAIHEGGHTPFTADITHALKNGQQTVTVRAEDDPIALDRPRGKQDWQRQPHHIWYPRTTGIWQPVWLEPVDAVYLTKLYFTPNLTDFAIQVEAHVNNSQPDLVLELEVKCAQEIIACYSFAITDTTTRCQIHFPDPGIYDARNSFLWSPEQPTLISVHATLRHEHRPIDEVFTYTALRSVEARGDAFHLNGRPYFLRLALDQGYWPESYLAAPSGEALKRDVELAKALGFNGVRKHQKIEDPRYLFWADTLGLLVWEELPSAYQFGKTSIKGLVKEWMEVLERDYSHPCIVAWVTFNESWGVPDLPSNVQQRHLVETLYHLTKTFDSSRPVIGNDGWEHVITDMLTIHDYHRDPNVLLSRYNSSQAVEDTVASIHMNGRVVLLDGVVNNRQPVILSEFGGIRLRAEDPGWGYSEVKTPEDLVETYKALVSAASSEGLAGFCYTQFADTFQEQNGLLYEDRSPKADLQAIAAATRNES